MTPQEAEAWKAETVAFYADGMAESEVARRKAERERNWLIAKLGETAPGRALVNRMRRAAA